MEVERQSLNKTLALEKKFGNINFAIFDINETSLHISRKLSICCLLNYTNHASRIIKTFTAIQDSTYYMRRAYLRYFITSKNTTRPHNTEINLIHLQKFTRLYTSSILTVDFEVFFFNKDQLGAFMKIYSTNMLTPVSFKLGFAVRELSEVFD